MRRSLLVPRQDVLESALLEDFVINRDDRSARVTENLCHPFLGERPTDDLSACNRRSGRASGRLTGIHIVAFLSNLIWI